MQRDKVPVADFLPVSVGIPHRLLLQNLTNDKHRGIFLAVSDDVGLITVCILRPGFNCLELTLQSYMNSLILITGIPLSYPQGMWFCILYWKTMITAGQWQCFVLIWTQRDIQGPLFHRIVLGEVNEPWIVCIKLWFLASKKVMEQKQIKEDKVKGKLRTEKCDG